MVQVPETLFQGAALRPNPVLAVPVLYEDGALVAIDKPPGMPSHALRAHESDTAANFLLAHDAKLATVGKSPLEPGIVHRLDTDTSGVLLAARTAAAYHALRRQFSSHQVTKEYFAVVHGDVASAGEVRTPIGRDGRDRRRMRVCATAGRASAARPALTSYRPVERFGTHTLLAVKIRTGVMHQIRVHLASIGHPVAGDRLYGPHAVPGEPARHMLHASRLGFTHPVTGRSLRVSSPLPADFAEFLETLRRR
jgi:23S rRNA pseudouridine1911/1915/1917 synthase